MANQVVNSDSKTKHSSASSIPPKTANVLICLFSLSITGLVLGIVLASLNKLPAPIAFLAGIFWIILPTLGTLIVGMMRDEDRGKFFKIIGEIYPNADHRRIFALIGIGIALLLSALVIFVPYFYTDPYTHQGLIKLDDSLQSNGTGLALDQRDGICDFVNGQYLVSAPDQNTFQPCIAHATNFQNFVFQVQMTINEGDCGAIIFRRSSETAQEYFFRICKDGSYILLRYDALGSNGPTGQLAHRLDSQAVNPAINKGLHRVNLLSVVANGSNIDLWVNNNKVSSVVGTAYTNGEIGFAANSLHNPTEVVFSNLKVWTF